MRATVALEQPAEMRVRFAGRSYVIRYNAGDPNWRVLALARFNPLSNTAFALRKAPHTTAERAEFEAWADAEAVRISRDLL